MLRWSAGSRGPGPWGAGAQGLRPLGWDHDDIRGRARVCPAPRPAVMGTAPPPSPPSRPTAPGQAGCSSPNPQGRRAGLGDADNLSRVGGGGGERPRPSSPGGPQGPAAPGTGLSPVFASACPPPQSRLPFWPEPAPLDSAPRQSGPPQSRLGEPERPLGFRSRGRCQRLLGPLPPPPNGLLPLSRGILESGCVRGMAGVLGRGRAAGRGQAGTLGSGPAAQHGGAGRRPPRMTLLAPLPPAGP